MSFEEFSQAAELILDKRKREKLKMYQEKQQNNSNKPSIPASNYNYQLNDQYSTVVTVQPPPPIAAPPTSHQRIVSANTSRPNSSTNNNKATC